MRLSDDQFDNYVCQAIDSIEPPFRAYLDQIPVIVEDSPDQSVQRKMQLPHGHSLLGIFRGVPLNRQSVLACNGPNQIVLYRRNILAACRTRTQLAERIRRTVVHELGHYLGFSDAQLRSYNY